MPKPKIKDKKEGLPPPTERRRGRPKVMPDEVQRSLIVASAGQLLMEKGYGRTTTDDVAARCHISKQTLYRLFPGKPALFAAVIDANQQSLISPPKSAEGLALNEALEKMFKLDVDSDAEKERISLVLTLMLEAPQFPELWEIMQHHGLEASSAELADWLAVQKKRGRINIDDAESAAGMLMDMVFGRVFRTMIGTPWPSPQQMRTHVRRCVSVFLEGVSPRRAC